VFAVPKLLKRFDLTNEDIGLWELNEAAVRVIYCQERLGLPSHHVRIPHGDTHAFEARSRMSDMRSGAAPSPTSSVSMASNLLLSGTGTLDGRLPSRSVHIAGITPHPDSRWMTQIARYLTDFEDGFLRDTQYLIPDGDTKYSAEFCIGARHHPDAYGRRLS